MGGRGCKVTNKFSNNTHSFPSKKYSKPYAFTLFMKSHLFNIESEKSIIPPRKRPMESRNLFYSASASATAAIVVSSKTG